MKRDFLEEIYMEFLKKPQKKFIEELWIDPGKFQEKNSEGITEENPG